METKEIEIKNIKVENRIREVNIEKVGDIAASIDEIGLQNPIIVDENHRLISGLHRLEAFKLLGRDKITAKIDDEGDPLRNELKEIDENLMRAELHYTERGDLLSRRKKIYEELHPETAIPGRGQNQYTKNMPILENKIGIPSFINDTKNKTSRGHKNENYNNFGFKSPSFVSDTSEIPN